VEPSTQHARHSDDQLRALLGPTNTGKTHRAIERMLEFETGMMGLPLRLLAREVYDRVSARVGEQAAALVTGEEKRVPARPRYWICTIEAMPPGIDVEFLAIDEIQLIGHRERGHVFTDRLLYWRGRKETWFLGSDTVKSLLCEQLPSVRVERLPRLSRLRCEGQASVRTLPRRSAVVAFSMQQVYELADVFRVRRGGAAVVLGALSPRVRNAQVAMYQAGEVDFLVATDAIGMGLNLDIEHVALAADMKFDGRETRPLEVTELAQIVGRAGRYLRDGSFGTLAPMPEFSKGVAQQLEMHRFAHQRVAYYRNAQLDFSSLDALLRTLQLPPPANALRSAEEADDVALLRALIARPQVRARCQSPEEIETLWGLCRIPNYEKHIPEHQAERLLPLLEQLVTRGQLDGTYLDDQLRRLERYDGDIDVLTARLSAVRTWLYVCHQRGWVDGARSYQTRTRELEDRLGDLLHERLLARFVTVRPRSRSTAAHSSARVGAQEDNHHPFAKLAQWLDTPPTGGDETARWVESLVSAAFSAFELNVPGELWFEGVRVAQLTRGKAPLAPLLTLRLPFEVSSGARARIERRLQAHTQDLLAHLLAPLYPPERAQIARGAQNAPLRGVLYQLEQGFGSVARRDVNALLAQMSPAEQSVLAHFDVHVGRTAVYVREMLSTDRLRIRVALNSVWSNIACEEPLDSDARGWQLKPGVDVQLCLRLGFVPVARWAMRCDVLEVLLEQLARMSSADRAAREARARIALGCSQAQAQSVVRLLSGGRGGRRRRKRRPVRQTSTSQ